MDVNAAVSGPGDQQRSIPLKQVGPRRYQATFPTWGAGLYQINALGKGGQDREDRVNGGFIVSYSPEYLKFTSNYEVLRDIVSSTKGQELTPAATKEEIYGRREPKSSSQPIFDWLLYGLAILIPIDVGLRRVQLDWKVIKGWLGIGRRQETTATMGALLKRKESVGSQLKTRSERHTGAGKPVVPPSYPLPGQSGMRTTAPKPPSTPSKPGAPTPPSESTTSRLLDMKRKRQDGGEEKT